MAKFIITATLEEIENKISQVREKISLHHEMWADLDEDMEEALYYQLGALERIKSKLLNGDLEDDDEEW